MKSTEGGDTFGAQRLGLRLMYTGHQQRLSDTPGGLDHFHFFEALNKLRKPGKDQIMIYFKSLCLTNELFDRSKYNVCDICKMIIDFIFFKRPTSKSESPNDYKEGAK